MELNYPVMVILEQGISNGDDQMNHQILSRIATVMAVSILLTGILGCVSEKTNALDPMPNSEPRKESISADQQPTLDVDTNLVDANTKFGFKLFSEILKQDTNKNVFVSPTSIAIALDMAYNGASGETQEAMAKVLELEGLSLDQLNQGNNALKASLENADPDVQLSIANSLWANQGIDINPKFIKNNQEFYKAEVTELNFSSAKAAKEINRWVKKNTNGKIKTIVERTQADDLLFLINAIYFKGSWTREFDKSQTSDQAFYISDVNQKQHPMMYQYGKYQYYENDDFQAVSIPYGKERLSLYVFLPREGSSLAEFQQQLTAENWLQWMKEFKSRDGSIRLPRFKFEYDIKLNNSLKALGMDVAFTDNADFSNLTSESAAISQVKHKTFVEVNEEGTEAAAATSIGIVSTSISIDQPFNIVVNRPFFCTVRDNKTGAILFMGSIVEP